MPRTDRRRTRGSWVQKQRTASGDAIVPPAAAGAEKEATAAAEGEKQKPLFAPPERRPQPKPIKVVGFDFDCTITVRHFFKVFAWGYAQGHMGVHAHCKNFLDWCEERGVSPEMQSQPDPGDLIGSALEDFCRLSGDAAFRGVFREVFCGGEERIRMLTDWMDRMRNAGVEFAIVTAGTSTAVVRALAVGVPEWLPFFPSDRVWDTQQGRHACRGVAAQKVLMLRDICPKAAQIVFVDDSVERDRPPAWSMAGAQVELFVENLPYEGPGITAPMLEKLEKQLLG